MKALAREIPMVQLCRQYGISRKTGYKWLARFETGGLEALVDESRRPDTSPVQTTVDMAVEIIKLRQLHPTWGARKLQALIAKQLAGEGLPSSRTIARVLDRAALTKKRRYRARSKGLPAHAPSCAVEGPNDLWTVDFKGWWYTADRRRCDPLTIRDAHSRMVLALKIVEKTRTEEVKRVFEELFEAYGLPKTIQSDNGPPFASVKAIGGLTKLSAWWVSLGIEVVRSRPGCPQDNGGHERMHGDIRLEVQAHAAASIPQQQASCDAWRVEFNHVRPHEALGMKTPSELYRPSPRRPGRVLIGGFPDGAVTAVVSRQGTANYLGKRVYVSLALPGYQVAFEHRTDIIRVWLFGNLLGGIDPALFAGQVNVSVEPIRSDETDGSVLEESTIIRREPTPRVVQQYARRGNPNLARAAEERRRNAVTPPAKNPLSPGDTNLLSPGDAVTCHPAPADMSPPPVAQSAELQPPVSRRVRR